MRPEHLRSWHFKRLPSLVLGLELGENDGVFGLYDPNRSVWLQPLEKQVEQVEKQVKQETEARRRAEAELAKVLT